jgi:hypothetical protein
MSPAAQDDISAAQAEDLGDAKAGLDRHQEQGSIAPACPGSAIGSFKESINLVTMQEFDGPTLVSFVGDGENALAQQRIGGLIQRHVSKEGSDSGKPGVSGPCGAAAAFFKVLEKFRDEGRVQLFQFQLRGRFAQTVDRKTQEQSEGVTIAGDRIGARPPLLHQSVGEK